VRDSPWITNKNSTTVLLSDDGRLSPISCGG
jgi:hypothetical protein